MFLVFFRLDQCAVLLVGPVSAINVSVAPHIHPNTNPVRAAELPDSSRSMQVHLPRDASVRANVASEVPEVGAKGVVRGASGVGNHRPSPKVRECPLAPSVSGEGGLKTGKSRDPDKVLIKILTTAAFLPAKA